MNGFYLAYAELVKPFDCIFISSVKRLDPIPGYFVNGHSLTICDIVCLPPHAQNGSSSMSQSYRVAAQRQWPVRYRLRIVQSLLLRSKPGCPADGWIRYQELVGYIILEPVFFPGVVYWPARTGHCRPYENGWININILYKKELKKIFTACKKKLK